MDGLEVPGKHKQMERTVHTCKKRGVDKKQSEIVHTLQFHNSFPMCVS